MAAGGIHTSLEHEPCGRHGTYRAINNQQGRERRADVRGRAQVREIRRQLEARKWREMGTKTGFILLVQQYSRKSQTRSRRQC